MLKDIEEKYLKDWFRIEKILEKKRPFSAEKLTMEEFSNKYWMRGECPYQYHEVTIEDGRNELEQLMINNIRELKNREAELRRMILEKIGEKQKQLDEIKRETAHTRTTTKIAFIMYAVMMSVSVITVIQQIRHCRKNTRSS